MDGKCGDQSYNDATVFEFSRNGSGVQLEYGGRDALAPWAPAVNGKVGIGFESGGVRVTTDRDAYPHFEVVQYKRGADPVFLARDRHYGGPMLMAPPAPNSHLSWFNGQLTPSILGNDYPPGMPVPRR